MTAEQAIEELVGRFLAGYSGAGVVGVSGGADSVALLRALVAVGRAVTVAHVHHGLRGAEADADEEFVRRLCQQLGVGYECRRVDVSAWGKNVEEAGRRARYAFFAEVAQRVQAQWVAVAHTADDQAETILHRLIRGTGLSGLRGMAAERTLPLPGGGTVALVRPLLTVRRQQVRAYLHRLGQAYREDSSNRNVAYTRNRIRHEVVPLLESFNPRVVEALCRLGEQVAEAEEVLVGLAQDLLQRAERPRAGEKVVLDVGVLQSAPPLIQRGALRSLWQREGWPVGDMDYTAWHQVVELCQRSETAWDFPSGVHLRRQGRVVLLWRDN
jgi:tRNA(Ile)-lysidine synthase